MKGHLNRLFTLICASTVFVTLVLHSLCQAATSIQYYGGEIIFYFEEDYPVGQFANGDFWVHNSGDAVVISSIFPSSQNNGTGRIINGAMINPPDSTFQGYDSSPRDMGYSSSLNIDPGNTGTSIVATPGSSIIKSISMESDAGRPIISDAAVLTVLATPPSSDSFRPPYSGSNKQIIATEADLDYSQLGNFARLGNEPDINAIANRYRRVWLEHCTEWVQRDIHPQNNMPAYGRDIANSSGTGLLLLQLDYTNQEKRDLLIRLVQYGIDIYGIARDGGNWYNNGGHNLGRKLPLLLAAKVLNNSAMLAYADKAKHFMFQDDQQHFYVSQTEVDITHSPNWDPDERATPIPYTSSDIGMPEWGIRHATKPEADNKNWGATYRGVNGPAQTLHIFAAQLLGAKKLWNWPAVFDYADRYYAIEQPKGTFPNYFVELWENHRNNIRRNSSILFLLPKLPREN